MRARPISVECLFPMTLLPIDPEGKSCPDLGRVLFFNDPAAWCTHRCGDTRSAPRSLWKNTRDWRRWRLNREDIQAPAAPRGRFWPGGVYESCMWVWMMDV